MGYALELPAEIWIQVFKSLSISELLNIVQVSKHFYDIVHMANLLSLANINKIKVKIEGYLPLLKMRRFNKKTAMDLKEHHDSYYATKSVHIDWLRGDLWGEKCKLDLSIANFTSKYHLDDFSHAKQIELLKYLKKEKHNLKTINFEANKLSKIPPDLLCDALATLEVINLEHTLLTSVQLHTIFENISANKFTKLTEFGISSNDLSEIPKELLDGLLKIRRVNLSKTNLIVTQVDYILNKISEAGTDLVLTDLSLADCTDLYNRSGPTVEPDLLGVAISKLTTIDLATTLINTSQVASIVERNIQFSNLRCINLSLINLAEVDVAKLSKFASSLKVIDMSSSSLTQDQIRGFLKESLHSSSLQGLSLTGHFENFDEALFVEAFSRLKRFVLTKGGCHDKEIESNVWESLMESETLEDVNIHALSCCWKNLTEVSGLEERFPTALKNFSCNEDRWFFINL
eukprot:GFUD01010178.1.p1 GENE.GFUD01010178.1~~GFUD01010178.1.p1  ORF type:complete len:460 (-),score=110.83 GFUD01010178.1:47-1426(-)